MKIQNNKKRYRSIKRRVGLLVGIGVGLTVMTLAIFATIRFRETSIKDATELAKKEAKNYAASIKATFELPFHEARALAEMYSAIADKDANVKLTREEAENMAKVMLLNHESFLGLTLGYEPNAFDGEDNKYANTKKSDKTGRFISYITKDGKGGTVVEALIDYENEAAAPWYWIPKRSMKEFVNGPVIYPIQGENVFMISFMCPVKHNNQFLGVTGLDISVNFLQSLVESNTLFEGKAQVQVISNNGMYAANSKDTA